MSEIEPNAAGPDPEEAEEAASPERRQEEEAQRGPGSENPDGATRFRPGGMRHQSATAHELARVELLACLPGETLATLGERMTRQDVAPGQAIVAEGERGDRFYVVLAGMLSVAQQTRGERRTLRPGDYFGEVGLVMEIPRTATVRAVTPSVVASCDRETFDELVRPVFSWD